MPLSPMTLIAIVLAAAFASGLSALAARSSRRNDNDGGPWWGALAVGLAYVAAQSAISLPAFPPSDVTDRIPFLAVAASVVASILAGGRGVWWARLVGSLGLSVLIYFVMLGPVLGAGEYSEETITKLATIAGVSCLAMINVGLLATPSRRSEVWLAMTVLAFGAGVVLMLANSAVLFFMAGALGLILATSLMGGRGSASGGGIPVAATVLTALVSEGSVYASLSATPALIVAAAPITLWLVRIGPLARLGSKFRLALSTTLILISIAAAIYFAWLYRAAEAYGI